MKKSNFQLIIMIVCGLGIFIAVLIFAGIIPTPGEKSKATGSQGIVVMWGTYPQNIMTPLIEGMNRTNKMYQIRYEVKSTSTFQDSLVEAIASGHGPDLIILSNNNIISNSNKLYHIPYTTLTERVFRDTYVEEGSLLLVSDGILALPISIDPIIMYYNVNMFEEAGIATPPATWDDLIKIVPLLTKKNNDTITQSAIGMGTFANVNHAKDIIAMLLLQTSNPIVSFSGDTATSTLSAKGSESILKFYTGFADPLNFLYTWNRVQPNSRTAFTNESTAMYLGYASELASIVAKNPNLHFDITRVPTIATSTAKVTFGQMSSVGVVRTSRNLSTALTAAYQLSGQDFVSGLLDGLSLLAPVAPVRRDLLSKIPNNIYGPLVFGSALTARGWRDPNNLATDQIFSALIDDIVRGAVTVSEAIVQAEQRLNMALITK